MTDQEQLCEQCKTNLKQICEKHNIEKNIVISLKCVECWNECRTALFNIIKKRYTDNHIPSTVRENEVVEMFNNRYCKFTKHELAEMFCVTTRTIDRDLDSETRKGLKSLK